MVQYSQGSCYCRYIYSQEIINAKHQVIFISPEMCLYHPSFSKLMRSSWHKRLWYGYQCCVSEVVVTNEPRFLEVCHYIYIYSIKAVLSAETFGSEMSSGMFQLMAQRRIGRFILTDFMKLSTWRTCSDRDWLSNDWRMFSFRWRNGCRLWFGLEDEVSGGMRLWIGIEERELYCSLSKRVYHVLETYTRTTETHQTLWA